MLVPKPQGPQKEILPLFRGNAGKGEEDRTLSRVITSPKPGQNFPHPRRLGPKDRAPRDDQYPPFSEPGIGGPQDLGHPRGWHHQAIAKPRTKFLLSEDELQNRGSQRGETQPLQLSPSTRKPRGRNPTPQINPGRVIDHVHMENGRLFITHLRDGPEISGLSNIVVEHHHVLRILFFDKAGQKICDRPFEIPGHPGIAGDRKIREEAIGGRIQAVIVHLGMRREGAGPEDQKFKGLGLGPALDEGMAHRGPPADGHLLRVVSQMGSGEDHKRHSLQNKSGTPFEPSGFRRILTLGRPGFLV